MAYIACLDGRTNARPELYRDVVEGKAVEVNVPQGRGIVYAAGLKRVVITSDVILVCCDDLFRTLIELRRREDRKCSLNQVRVAWDRVKPENYRDIIRVITSESKSIEQDFWMFEAVRDLCRVCVLTRHEHKFNIFFLPPVEGAKSNMNTLMDNAMIERGRDTYNPNLYTLIVQPMLVKDVWVVFMWDFSKRVMKTLVFDRAGYRKAWDYLNDYLRRARDNFYKLGLYIDPKVKNLYEETQAKWSDGFLIATAAHEVNKVTRSQLNHKIFTLMYDIALHHLEYQECADRLGVMFKDERNITRAMSVIQAAMIAAFHGTPRVSAGGHPFRLPEMDKMRKGPSQPK